VKLNMKKKKAANVPKKHISKAKNCPKFYRGILEYVRTLIDT